jgi:hypothetical protein
VILRERRPDLIEPDHSPVYIDTLMTCLVSKAWKWPKSCHMFVDTTTDLEALHRFAARIGLRRAWFQNKPGKMPHYDLNPARRKAALAEGAIELDRQSAVMVIRRWRSANPVSRPGKGE